MNELYLRLIWVGVHIIAMVYLVWRLYKEKDELRDMVSKLDHGTNNDGWNKAIELQEDNIGSTYTWILFVFLFMAMDIYKLVGEL